MVEMEGRREINCVFRESVKAVYNESTKLQTLGTI